MNKKYINSNIEKDIKEKGFSVYNYISIKELLLTMQRDYLLILSNFNTIFAVISIIIGYISFELQNFTFLFGFLLFVYSIIFIYLIFKLLKRVYFFLLVSDIIYTDKGIILGEDLYNYKKDSDIIDEKLLKYEEYFDEYLSKESQLSEIIRSKKESLTCKIFKNGGKILKNSSDMGNEGAKFMIIIFLLYVLYGFSLFIFYYIGYFVGFFIFLIFGGIIKILLFFRKSIEIKIKNKIEGLDQSFINMNKIYELINKKINNFDGGEISDISKFIGNNFNSYYSKVLYVYDEKKSLFNLIEKSKYKEFIDFKLLQKYLNNNFNKPVADMIGLLNKYENILKQGLKDLDKSISKNKEFRGNFEKKKLILQNQLDVLMVNKSKLSKSLL